MIFRLNRTDILLKSDNNDDEQILSGNVITDYMNNILYNAANQTKEFGKTWHKIVFRFDLKRLFNSISVDCLPVIYGKASEFYANIDIKNFQIYLKNLKYFDLISIKMYDNLLEMKPFGKNCTDLDKLNGIEILNYDKRIPNLSCLPSKTIVKNKTMCKGQLIFEDNFEKLDLNKWEKEIRIPLDTEDAEFVTYQDYSENCFIKSNNLIILPTLLSNLTGFNISTIQNQNTIFNLGSKCTWFVDSERECIRKVLYSRILPPIVSAKINTKTSFSFRYGKIVVRAKLPKGDWIFPQIFLEPNKHEYGKTEYKSGQIRIAFARGNEILSDKNFKEIDGFRIYSGVVLTSGALQREIWMRNRLEKNHLNSKFHIYQLIWTDESIIMSIDGNEYGSINGGFKDIQNISNSFLWQNGDYMAPFDKEFHLSLGISVGGISDFPDDSKNGNSKLLKPWRNTSPKGELRFWQDRNNWLKTWNSNETALEIDYIKVWAL